MRKLILTLGILGVVIAGGQPAHAGLESAAAAAITGTVGVAGPGAACPAATYSHTGTFTGLVMGGTFADGAPTQAYLGTVTAPAPITACLNAMVEVNAGGQSVPLISEGDIRPGGFVTQTPVIPGTSLVGGIERGGFITAGVAAAVHFSIDYSINGQDVAGTDDVNNLSCLGGFGVVPSVTGASQIAGGIACADVVVP